MTKDYVREIIKRQYIRKNMAFWRNINLLGAAAIGGAAIIIPGPNAVLSAWVTFAAVQASGLEVLRQHSEKKHKKTDWRWLDITSLFQHRSRPGARDSSKNQ